jgi:hypothetical protein
MKKKSYALREKQHIVLAEGLNFWASGGYAQIKQVVSHDSGGSCLIE